MILRTTKYMRVNPPYPPLQTLEVKGFIIHYIQLRKEESSENNFCKQAAIDYYAGGSNISAGLISDFILFQFYNKLLIIIKDIHSVTIIKNSFFSRLHYYNPTGEPVIWNNKNIIYPLNRVEASYLCCTTLHLSMKAKIKFKFAQNGHIFEQQQQQQQQQNMKNFPFLTPVLKSMPCGLLLC